MKPAPPRPTFRGMAVIVTVLVACVALWYAATPGPLLLGDAEIGPAYAVRAVAVSAAVLGLATVLVVAVSGLRRSDVGLGLPHVRRSWWEAVALLPVVAGVLYLAVDPAPFRADYPWPSAAWLQLHPSRWFVWSAGYALYYLAYESFFRGAVLGWAERRFGRASANVLQTVLSTLVHLGKPWPETLAALPAGLAFGWLRFRWRSVVPVALVHLAVGLTLDVVLVTSAAP